MTNTTTSISPTFEQWTHQLEQFWAERQCNPSILKSEPEHRKLSDWLARTRLYGSPEQKQRLDEVTPYWRSSRINVLMARRVARLREFHEKNGRPPAHRDGSEIYRLVTWLQQVLDSADAEQMEYLDEYLDWWRTGLRGGEVRVDFEDRLDQLTSFRAKRGRLPALSVTDMPETELYHWLCSVRASHTITQAHALDARVKDWRRGSDSAPSSFPRSNAGRSDWDRVVRETVTFYSTHQRFPDSPGQVPGEAKLASWMTAAKTVPAMAQLRTALDTAVPGWRDTPAQRSFTARMDQLTRFRRSHPGSWPAPDSRDKDEQQLAWWLNKMSWLRKPQYHRALDERFPGWRTRTDPVTPAPRTLTKTTPEPSRA